MPESASLSDSVSGPVFGLLGSPNAGKTTLFNALTGLRARVGNYPGVTVERREANLTLDGGGKAALRPIAWVFSVLIVVMNLRYMLPFNVDAMFVTGIVVFLLWIPARAGDGAAD